MRQFTVLFLVTDGAVLLAMKKRGFGAGRWNGVGGKLEPGETPEQAAVRECQEEIGVTPLTIQKAAEIVFDEQHGGGRETIQAHVYMASAWQGDPVETEEMAPRWVQLDAIPYEEMWADDPYWLPQVLAGKKLSCTFVMDDHDQVVSQTVNEVTAW